VDPDSEAHRGGDRGEGRATHFAAVAILTRLACASVPLILRSVCASGRDSENYFNYHGFRLRGADENTVDIVSLDPY
jgi:hypothetical protein